MEKPPNFDLDQVQNIDLVLDHQIQRLDRLRDLVRRLIIVPIEPVSNYSAISYVSVDGGMMGIHLDPFDVKFIEIADSFGNEPLKFLMATDEYGHPENLRFMDDMPLIRSFLDVLGAASVTEIAQFPSDAGAAMEIAELSCIFDRLVRDPDTPLLLLKDGLLRTKSIKPECKARMLATLARNTRRKLVGVAKQSRVVSLLSSALHVEKKIPPDFTGFIEVPAEIERAAFTWPQNYKILPFGKLYIAKLSSRSNLLVTVEIPHDFTNNKQVYSNKEITEIIGCLAKDARYSFPTIGYPQTIMRAHEKAVQTGFTASIWRRKIIDRLVKKSGNERLKDILEQATMMRQHVERRDLGGT
ncbi:MAG: hypothetical protein GYA24_04590 [Candidatus Lokiarchaeota archaeon]|nr:hypothetical protein [Candidatus Lokiarchaeota archaeon]